MPRDARRTTVRLTGIALRQQGTHDSLCAYYAAAMLLCALRPELDAQFDAAHVAEDPLFGNLPRPRGRTVEAAAAEWLTGGVRMRALAQALNRAAAAGAPSVRTRFAFRTAGRGHDTVELIRAQIDRGLPCVLGWESGELGDHTALVVGYDRFAGSNSRWLRLLDPIRVQDVLEWGQLARLARPRVELIWCAAHDGVRPDKLTVARDRHGAMIVAGATIERWDPLVARWFGLVPR
jgi:hypothetical protein